MAEQLPLQFVFRADQTFADFFPGDNAEAVAHLQRSIAGKGEAFVYLWGGDGLGKTHLLHACCHAVHQQQRIGFYCDLADRDAITPEVLTGLESCDLVCLDNIDASAGHADWELALFNFFNRHRDLGRTLIVAAHCAPQALPMQLPDLHTRLNWGLALQIRAPNDKGRIAALMHKARRMGFEVSPSVGRFLLQHVNRDMAALWHLLDRLDRASLSAKRKLTVPFLKKILDDIPD